MNNKNYKEDLNNLIKLDKEIKNQYDFLIKQDKELIIMNVFEERFNCKSLREELKKKNIIINNLNLELKKFNDYIIGIKKNSKGINLRVAKLQKELI